MKIAQMKAIAGVVAVGLTGLATYTVVRGDALRKAPRASVGGGLDSPVPTPDETLPPGGQKDAYRNVVLVGKVRYEDGKAAGGVQVGAQIQHNAMSSWPAGAASAQMSEESWNNAVSRPDGTYTLPVGANIPYNVMVLDTTGKWVAAAAEGVSGQKDATVTVPDLVLTKGALVTGSVTDGSGKPVAGAAVMSYGPHRPATSASVIVALTDQAGRYRLRVATGLSRVYISQAVTGGGRPDASQNVETAAGETKTVNFITQ